MSVPLETNFHLLKIRGTSIFFEVSKAIEIKSKINYREKRDTYRKGKCKAQDVWYMLRNQFEK